MKKLIAGSLVVATGLLFGLQAQAAPAKNQEAPNKNNAGLEGYYANLGIGITHKDDLNQNGASWNIGVGDLYAAPFHATWGWESNVELLGDSVYGINGDGVINYKLSEAVSAFGKAGLLVAHAGSLKAGIQLGEGFGYMVTRTIRTSVEFMHTFSVRDGMTSYLLSTQIFWPSMTS